MITIPFIKAAITVLSLSLTMATQPVKPVAEVESFQPVITEFTPIENSEPFSSTNAYYPEETFNNFVPEIIPESITEATVPITEEAVTTPKVETVTPEVRNDLEEAEEEWTEDWTPESLWEEEWSMSDYAEEGAEN